MGIEYALSTLIIPKDSTFILDILKNNISYEYLITNKSTSNHLIIFNNGAVAKGNVIVRIIVHRKKDTMESIWTMPFIFWNPYYTFHKQVNLLMYHYLQYAYYNSGITIPIQIGGNYGNFKFK